MTQKKRAYRALQVGGALVALLLIIMWMSGSFTAKIDPGSVQLEREKVAPDALMATAEEAVTPVIEEVAGTIESARKTAVSSRIMALVRRVAVSAGDEVAAGQTLILLDDRDLLARRQEAEKAVEAASATRAKAESDFRRAKELLAQQVMSQSEFDQAASAYKIAEARRAAAQESVEAARVAVSFAEIKAPIDGRVIDRLAEPGDTASPGRPLLRLYDPKALRIEAAVRESVATRLQVGDQLSVRIGNQNATVAGIIDEIVPQAEAGSRTFLVKVGLPKQEGIFTGMFGRLLIPTGMRKRILIPAAAVEQIGQLSFVSTVGRGGRISRRLVTLGAKIDEERVEVLSGLKPGAKVLLP